jgi:tRNA-specific 2-thiouridylase
MRTAVLVSGGVDSSVALARVIAEGAQPVAYYLKVWLEDELGFLGECPWEEDLGFARSVCDRLGVPLQVVPLQRAYRERIVELCLAELRAGRTPTPDVFCNREIKLGAFLDEVGPTVTTVATGHYARRTIAADGSPQLALARDRTKDQTYFLSRLDPGQLARARFPLGDLPKPEVRRVAAELGLTTASRPDSQGICFLGRIRWRDFIEAHLGAQPGPIVDEHGRELGQHRGHWFVTLGQRHGLGLGGGPWFVVAKDSTTNVVTVRHGSSPLDDRREIPVEEAHWIAAPASLGERVKVKVRHGPALAGATWRGSHVTLDQGDRGTAPGQLVVVYRDEVCLGSALIASR